LRKILFTYFLFNFLTPTLNAQTNSKATYKCFKKKSIETFNSLGGFLSDPWRLQLDSMIYGEGLDLPVIIIYGLNEKTEKNGYNEGPSIIVLLKNTGK
tara:strand:+ start:1199 stop:1492 length:294 start_codon:yes stop_codon:yes gene_type:complete